MEQADQGDLDKAKEKYANKKYPQFRQAIDKAFKAAPPAGSRHLLQSKRPAFWTVLASITKASDADRPGSIIKDYLLGEKEKTKEGESEMHKKKIPASITLYDAPGSGGETPVEHNSGPSLESEKAKENKASVGEASSTVEGGRSEVVSSAVSEGGAESDDALGKEFREAVDGENFEWLKDKLGELEGA